MKELVRVISKKRDESDFAQPEIRVKSKLLGFAQPSKADPDINSADLNC